ncbi:MAG: hypothetical protein QG646_3007 [Euryarchaeota archaeon]|nr:hypothetical protein [Euryarchaeota archaeon]
MEKTLKDIYLKIIGTIITTISVAIIGFLFSKEQTTILGIYFLLMFVVIYLLFGKEISLSINNLRMSISRYNIRFRLIILIIIVIVITAPLVFYYFNYYSSRTIPDLKIVLTNNGSNVTHLSNHGEFHIITNERGYYHEALCTLINPGEVEFKSPDNNQDGFIVKPNEKLIVSGHIITREEYLPLFERGDTHLKLILYQKDTKMDSMFIPSYSYSIPINKDIFSTQWVLEIGNSTENVY